MKKIDTSSPIWWLNMAFYLNEQCGFLKEDDYDAYKKFISKNKDFMKYIIEGSSRLNSLISKRDTTEQENLYIATILENKMFFFPVLLKKKKSISISPTWKTLISEYYKKDKTNINKEEDGTG